MRPTSHVVRRAASLPALAALTASAVFGGAVPSFAADEFTEDFSQGMSAWRPIGSSTLADWKPAADADNTWVNIDNRTQSSGSYVTPKASVQLPTNFEVTYQLSVEALGTSGNVSLVVGLPSSATAIQTGGTALQISGDGSVRTSRPVASPLCSTQAPVTLGQTTTVTAQQYDGLLRFLVNGQQVAVHTATTGDSIALGSYRSNTRFSGVQVRALPAKPTGFPTTASGCGWAPPAEAQPVLANQSGYDIGLPKRFTAPHAANGEEFVIRDSDGRSVWTGSVSGHIGDFTEFNPTREGPYVIDVTGEAGVGSSTPFGIGKQWTTRISISKALRFMGGSLCHNADFASVGKGLLTSEKPGPTLCSKAVAWRDSSQYGFEMTSLADLLESNPSIALAVPGDSSLLKNAPHQLPADAPLIAQLLYWGAEVYIREKVNEPQLKGQLASFLAAYPLLSEWIPKDTYDRALAYVAEHWTDTARDRFVWQAYTPNYDGNLLGVYTQVGTGKGELAPGHSIIPNLRMYEVATRENRGDAQSYLNAAVAQADWIATHLDPADPRVTKGQRQSEWLLVTSLARLAQKHPEVTPESIGTFVSRWSDVVIERSDNLWDFRKYDDSGSSSDRWTIPTFTGGGTGEDPNEAGNVAGMAAPALAAASMLSVSDPRSERLRQVAIAHIDNLFGRNPVGRAAQYRISDPNLGYEGLDRGWFSEYQGGFGRLQGLPGVLDGSPKNGHYPFNSTMGNIGHTEGWVNFNAAFNASLAWISFTHLDVELAWDGASTGPEQGAVVTATVTGVSDLERRTDVIPTAYLRLGTAPAKEVPLTQKGDDIWVMSIDTSTVQPGEPVSVTVGAGDFAKTSSTKVTYPWEGFLSPVENIDANGNLVLNQVKAGATVPIKFNLSGDHGLDVLASGSPTSTPITCDPSVKVEEIGESAISRSVLIYDSTTGNYQYNWKTEKGFVGCRELTLTLNDGTVHQANFRFTK